MIVYLRPGRIQDGRRTSGGVSRLFSAKYPSNICRGCQAWNRSRSIVTCPDSRDFGQIEGAGDENSIPCYISKIIRYLITGSRATYANSAPVPPRAPRTFPDPVASRTPSNGPRWAGRIGGVVRLRHPDGHADPRSAVQPGTTVRGAVSLRTVEQMPGSPSGIAPRTYRPDGGETGRDLPRCALPSARSRRRHHPRAPPARRRCTARRPDDLVGVDGEGSLADSCNADGDVSRPPPGMANCIRWAYPPLFPKNCHSMGGSSGPVGFRWGDACPVAHPRSPPTLRPGA